MARAYDQQKKNETNRWRTRRKRDFKTRIKHSLQGWKQWPKKVWAILLLAISLASAVVGLLGITYFLPSITVTVSDSSDPSNPFITPIEVQNSGHVTEEGMTATYTLQNVYYATSTGTNRVLVTDVDSNFGGSQLPTVIGGLRPGESTTFMLDGAQGAVGTAAPVQSANMLVHVSYTTWHGVRTETFRFSTFQSSDRHIHWVPEATDK